MSTLRAGIVNESRGSALASLAALLLAFGGVWLLHEFSVLPAPRHLLWLLLVYIGVRGARHTEGPARVISVVLLVLGVVAQAAVLEDLPAGELGLLAPLAGLVGALGVVGGLFTRVAALGILLAGVLLLMRARRATAAGATARPADAAGEAHAGDAPAAAAGDTVDEFAMFSGMSRSVSSPAFRGGRLIAVFGGLELDLRRAAMARPEARLDVWCLFGGSEIKVPEGCEVIVRAVPIFGGINARASGPGGAQVASGEPPPGGRLVVGGLALFGGIDVEA